MGAEVVTLGGYWSRFVLTPPPVQAGNIAELLVDRSEPEATTVAPSTPAGRHPEPQTVGS
jgi:hypothetical protein